MKTAKKRRPQPKTILRRYAIQELLAQMPEHFEVPEDLIAWETMKPVGKELGSLETPWIAAADR